jgi:hypothetical protein
MARNTDGGPDDDRGMNPRLRNWNDRQVEALLRGRELTAPTDDPSPDTDLLSVLADLKAFATTATPPPSIELAAILNGYVAVPTADPIPALPRQANPLRNRIGAAVVLVTASLSLGTVATAANALPTGAQRAAATVLNTVTPFHFPKPQPAPPVHTPDPALSPSPEPSDEEAGTTNPTAPTAGPESDGERTGSPTPREDPTDAPGDEGETRGTTTTGSTGSTGETGDTRTSTESPESQPSASPEPADSKADPSTGHAGTRASASPTPTSQSDENGDSSSSG